MRLFEYDSIRRNHQQTITLSRMRGDSVKNHRATSGSDQTSPNTISKSRAPDRLSTLAVSTIVYKLLSEPLRGIFTNSKPPVIKLTDARHRRITLTRLILNPFVNLHTADKSGTL